MPVAMNEYCSLIVELRTDKIAVTTEWVSSISRHYELQSRLELFLLFKICCETLHSLCSPSPSFIVTIPCLESDMQDFSLVFEVYNAVSLPFRRSRVFSFLQMHFHVLTSWLVWVLGCCKNGNFWCGICCHQLTFTGSG